MHLRRSFPVRRDTYHSAVDFGAMVGARMAGYDWSPPTHETNQHRSDEPSGDYRAVHHLPTPSGRRGPEPSGDYRAVHHLPTPSGRRGPLAPPGSGGILGAASGPDGGVGAEVTQKQIISLGILGVGGVLATYLFMTGSMLSGTLILGATLLTGAVVEGGSSA